MHNLFVIKRIKKEKFILILLQTMVWELISVNVSFSELIDTEKIKDLMTTFYELTGIPSTLIDLDGNILTCDDGSWVAAGWQDICLNFHREHPETLKKCIESDIKLSNDLIAGEKHSCYKCYNGLVDMAVPIYVGGKHIANLFTGQFLFNSPDMEFFKKQAKKYGFDEEEYLEALNKVPVFSREFIENGIEFLKNLASIIGEMGLEKKKLLESKELYKLISENAGDVIWLLDINSQHFTYVSPSVFNLRGYYPHEVMGQSMKEIMTQESYDLIEKELPIRINTFLSGEQSLKVMTHEIDQIHVDGSVIPTEVVTTLLTNHECKVDTILGVSRDISERKKVEREIQVLLEETQQFAEELEVSNEELQATTEELQDQREEILSINQALKISEEKYRLLIENAGLGIALFSLDGTVLMFNQQAAQNLNGNPENFIGKNLNEFFDEKTASFYMERIKNVALSENSIQFEDKVVLPDKNRWFITRLTPIIDFEDKVLGVQAISTDITEQKEAKRALIESETLYQNILTSISDAVFMTDDKGNFTYICPNTHIIFGYSFSEVKKMENISRLLGTEILNLDATSGELENIEIEIIDKYDKMHVILTNIKKVPIFQDNVLYTCRDITERKKTEESLKDSEAKFREVFNKANDMISLNIMNEDKSPGNFIEINDIGVQRLGYTKEELLNMGPRDIVAEDKRSEMPKNAAKLYEKGHNTFEIIHVTKDGKRISVEVNNHLINYKGQNVCLAVSRDITERKDAEEELRLSNLYNRSLIEVSLDPLVTIGPDGKITDVNSSTEQVTGYSREELIGTDFSDYFTEPEKAREGYQKVFREGQVRDYPLEINNKNGKITPVLYNASVYTDEHGEVMGVFAAARDITDLKKIEKELLYERDNFKNILDSMEDGVYIVNSEYDIEYVNPQIEREFGLVKGKKCYEYLHDRNDVCPWCVNDQVLRDKSVKWEWYSEKANKTYDLFDTPIHNPDGTISKLEIFHDITDLKNAENEIKESLREKEILLREIHHRVKNNLQIVSSLLSLQTEFVEGEESIDVLMESRNRVQTMSIVHEELYKSSSLKDINFREFIENLISNLFYSYGVGAGTIVREIDVEDLNVGIDTAVPCGLVINELVTNSLKYAFPEGKGTIRIEFKKINDNFYLIISDDGIGMPENIEMENTGTLGLKMVSSLVDQLDGTLKLDVTNGTEFKIIFKELEYKDRI